MDHGCPGCFVSVRKARPVRPLGRDLREAAARRREVERVLAELPARDCAACGAPGCAAHAEDVVRGQAVLEDCVFVRLERLASTKERVQ